MKKLLKHCKDIFFGIADGIHKFKTYKTGKVK
jgi:hypothetical protein